MAAAAGVCECPEGQWVAAVEAAAAVTASAVTAVALADLPCSTDGLRCRLERRAGGVTGGPVRRAGVRFAVPGLGVGPLTYSAR